MSKASKKVELSYNAARYTALAEVERLARNVLKSHPHLDEFVMAMGTWFFTPKDDNRHFTLDDYSNLNYIKPIKTFIGEWDKYLKLTGEGIRFTADGPIVTDW